MGLYGSHIFCVKLEWVGECVARGGDAGLGTSFQARARPPRCYETRYRNSTTWNNETVLISGQPEPAGPAQGL